MNYVNQLLFNARHSRQKTHLFNKRFLLSVVFVLTIATQIFAQKADKTVSGTVRDENGQTLPGVSVSVKGTTNGAVTDTKGHYTIKINSSTSTLVFSFVGYISAQVAINNRTTIDVTMKDDQKTLSEVVVIGYQTVKKRDLTGAVASVSGKDIAAVPVPNIATAMQGKLPGVAITSQDGRPGGNINIRVRGGTSITQGNQPLILIDGIPGNLNDVPGDQVESIDVLKDASAEAIYGSRGANGVILVTTKSGKSGKPSVSYSGYVKINTPVKYLQQLGPYDYL